MIVALALIGMNSVRIVEMFRNVKPRFSGTIRNSVDPLDLYRKEMIPVTLISQFNDTLIIPDNNKHFILGLNNDFEKDFNSLKFFIKNDSLIQYNSNIIVVSLYPNLDIADDLNIYHYQSEILGDFFKISDNLNFTLLLNDDNTIEFFVYYLISAEEIVLLLRN